MPIHLKSVPAPAQALPLRPQKRLVSHLYPLGHLLNPATPYVPERFSDIRVTFARVTAERDAVARLRCGGRRVR